VKAQAFSREQKYLVQKMQNADLIAVSEFYEPTGHGLVITISTRVKKQMRCQYLSANIYGDVWKVRKF
jgi:hypothetical protein